MSSRVRGNNSDPKPGEAEAQALHDVDLQTLAERAPIRALVVVPVFARYDKSERTDFGTHAPAARAAEAEGLARAIDLDIRGRHIVQAAKPRAAMLIGTGKVEELGLIVAADEIQLVIVDHALAPVQQRNLEKAWKAKVLDRTGLILEIFGRRARTHEGRLQVELAHLEYQRSRLVRSWTHLERQRGGYGFLGGPGESQIEADRRIIRDRIAAIRRELVDVRRTRELHRGGRRRVPYPIVALVGYTNAGKSTLFNRVTGASVLAKDQLFATLDPTMREVRLGSGRRIILSDTVGFISHLPTMLVAAFRATLEEVIEADLILHIRDVAHEESAAQRADVEHVLRELGIDPAEHANRIVEVWNKIDLLPEADKRELKNASARFVPSPVLVSATTGEGLGQLLDEIEQRLGAADEVVDLTLKPGEGALRAWLHANARVLTETVDDDGNLSLRLSIDAARKGRLRGRLARRD
jgi:GTP-binding protein HflX